MIPRLVDFALRQRAIVMALAAVLAVFGLVAFYNLPIEAYPDVGDTWVQVITQWPGHAPEEVERQITIPIEREMNAVPKHATLRSVSIAGLSVVTLIFEDRTDSYFARQQVKERLDNVDLPEGARPDLGPLASPVGEIMRYQLVSCAKVKVAECTDEDLKVPALPLTEVKDLQDWVVTKELLGVPGVAEVSSFGGTTKQYQVLVDPASLASRNLTFADVENELARSNGNAGGGVIAFGGAALNVRGLGLLKPSQIGDVPIASHDGVPIRVKHIAKVEVGHRPRLGRVSVDDEDDTVAALVLLRKGEQAQTVLDALHARIADVNARVLPRGVKIHPYHDRTELMKLTTRTVLKNLVEGLVLVALVLLLFLGNARAALIVGLTVPLALLFAFVLMDRAKIPANLLSIGAIDFGMMVDGAIIMIENVLRILEERRHRGEHSSIHSVVAAAGREVARPIVFAKAMIVAAYLPIFTLERVEGKLFSPMAWTVAFALLGALLLAITFVPTMATVLFDQHTKEAKNPVVDWARRRYRAALARLIARPRWVLAAAALLVLADVVIGKRIGSEFLPHLDEGAIWVRATMPSNVSLKQAEQIVDGVHTKEQDTPGIREILDRFPEVRTMAAQIGRPDDGLDPTGFYNAEILLVLNDKSTWRPELHENKEALIEQMSDELAVVPGVRFGFSQPISDNVEEAMSGVKGQLAVKVVGDDLNALEDLAEQIAHTIKEVPGVEDLGIFRELGQSNVHIEVARARAERYGLDVADVEAAVERGIGGRAVTEIVEGERRHDLVVRYEANVRDDVDLLRALPVPVTGGRVVPLGEVADITIAEGASRIFREGNRRYIALKFSVRGRDLGSTVDDAQRRVGAAVRVPQGYQVSWEGEFESARRAAKRLAIVIPATLALIFVLLFALFRHPREALIDFVNVLVTSPVGGLLALLATRTNFSVSSGVGFLALFGVSVQTGVILVSDITERRKAGAARDEAILRSAELRLRPIVMTALVATLGLVPAAISTGIGSDSQKPLAIVVVGGLFSSLALSLFLLPALYKVFSKTDGAPASVPPSLINPSLSEES